jgi:REP element-mobilizing transposase RayT
MVTYRLNDAIPAAAAQRLAQEIGSPKADAAYRRRIESLLDAGHGACWLRRAEVARIVIDSWWHYHTRHYDLVAWVVMPNHVHVLAAMRERSLSDVVRGWKGFTARRINTLLGRTRRLWQADYWDRFIRDQQHLADAFSYIHENPVNAGLVARAHDWPWSSMPGARASTPAPTPAKIAAPANATPGARVSSSAPISGNTEAAAYAKLEAQGPSPAAPSPATSPQYAGAGVDARDPGDRGC